MNFRVATPAGVICAKPSRWISVQEGADASQNATCPTVSDELPARTLALRLTAVPAGTTVTGIPPAEIERFIVVGVVPACAAVAEHRTIPVSHFSAADGLTLILSPRFGCIARLNDHHTLLGSVVAAGSVEAAMVFLHSRH